MDLVALSNGLHGSVQMDSVALFSWIGWLRHHGILIALRLADEKIGESDFYITADCDGQYSPEDIVAKEL